MKNIILLIGAIIALFVVVANAGQLILLAVSVGLLYLVVKQFLKTESIFLKICWIIVGLVILSIGIANIYAIIGLVAVYVLYVIYKKWRNDKTLPPEISKVNDSFNDFDRRWQEIFEKN